MQRHGFKVTIFFILVSGRCFQTSWNEQDEERNKKIFIFSYIFIAVFCSNGTFNLMKTTLGLSQKVKEIYLFFDEWLKKYILWATTHNLDDEVILSAFLSCVMNENSSLVACIRRKRKCSQKESADYINWLDRSLSVSLNWRGQGWPSCANEKNIRII